MDEPELPGWMTEMDQEILKVLYSGYIMSPSIISENIDRSREAVGRRLSTLEAGNYVEKIDRGKYQITEEGRYKLREYIELPDYHLKEDEFHYLNYENSGLVVSYYEAFSKAILEITEDEYYGYEDRIELFENAHDRAMEIYIENIPTLAEAMGMSEDAEE
jgi:DNA-binding transcriptional ArsR family regulator